MKTTIDIADDLARQAKTLARKRGTTLRAIIEQGIRNTLAEEARTSSFELPERSVPGDGLQPAYRDRPWSDIRDAAYEGRGS